MALNTAWYELQTTPITSRNEQPNRLNQVVKWIPYEGYRAGPGKGSFYVSWKILDAKYKHEIRVDPDKIASNVDPPAPPALSPLAFEYQDFPEEMDQKHARALRLVEHWVHVLLPYRGDTEKTMRATWRLTTDARWIPGQGRSRQERTWHGEQQAIKITEPQSDTGRRCFALYTSSGPDIVLR